MTPERIDHDIARLISQLNSTEKPVFVTHRPEQYAQVNECFPAVEKMIAINQGAMCLGWQIWRTNLLVEAEFHAVWRSPQGELIDITPKPRKLQHILFLPMPRAKYDGAQVDNVRLNITGNKVVDDFVSVCEAIFKIENKGERAYQYGLRLVGMERERHAFLQELRVHLEIMASQGLTNRSLCFCGSESKYKHCHGKALKSALNAS